MSPELQKLVRCQCAFPGAVVESLGCRFVASLVGGFGLERPFRDGLLSCHGRACFCVKAGWSVPTRLSLRHLSTSFKKQTLKNKKP